MTGRGVVADQSQTLVSEVARGSNSVPSLRPPSPDEYPYILCPRITRCLDVAPSAGQSEGWARDLKFRLAEFQRIAYSHTVRFTACGRINC